MRRVFLCALFCVSALFGDPWKWSGSNADGFSVRITVEDNSVEVGNDVIFNLVTETPSGWEFDRESFERSLLTTTNRWFEVMSGSSSVQGNKIVWKLTPENDGEFYLNASIFQFLSNSGEKATLSGVMIPLTINADEVEVVDLEALTEDVLPLQLNPPMKVDKDIQIRWMGANQSERNAKIIAERTLPLGLFLFLLCCASALTAIWWWFDELSYAVKMHFYPPRTPKEEALFALKKMGKVDGEELHSGVSKIMRRYLEETYKLPFTRFTTRECLIALKKEEGVKGFFQSIELVKFANIKPTKEECQGVLLKAHALIQSSSSPEIVGESLPAAERG